MRRSRRGSRAWRATRSSSTPTFLPRRLHALRRLAAAGLALVEAPTERRTRCRCPTRASSRRSTARGAPIASARMRRSRPSRSRSSELDVDSDADLERPRAPARPADARASRRSRVKVVLLSGGGGGARFARGLARRPRARRAHGRSATSATTSRSSGLHVSPDLDSLLYTLGGLIDDGARLGTSRRDLECARVGGELRWRRTGSGSATATSASTSSARSALRDGTPLSEVTARLCGSRGRRPRDRSGDRRSAAHARPHARRAASRSRSGSSVAAIATTSTASSTTVRPDADAAPGVLDGARRSRRRSSSRRATRTSRSARSSPSPRFATRSSDAARAVSP